MMVSDSLGGGINLSKKSPLWGKGASLLKEHNEAIA